MNELTYVRAKTLPHALDLLNEPGYNSRLLAGGTDLMVQRRQSSSAYDRVVDISRIPALHTITADSNQITLGAGVTFSEVLASHVLKTRVPLLLEACAQIGSVQIRNRGTVGGNVANAAACADVATVLVCLDAEAVIMTRDGTRCQPVGTLLQDIHQASFSHSGLIRAFVFNTPPDPARTAYERLARRQAMAIARLSVAACADLDDHGKVADLRIVQGAAFPTPRRMHAVEDHLLGHRPSPERIKEAANLMVSALYDAGERWSTPYKARALPATTARALQRVFLDS